MSERMDVLRDLRGAFVQNPSGRRDGMTEFLLARIAERERGLCDVVDDPTGLMRRDLEAQRCILADVLPHLRPSEHLVIAAIFAAVYYDHPDYNPAWQPVTDLPTADSDPGLLRREAER